MKKIVVEQRLLYRIMKITIFQFALALVFSTIAMATSVKGQSKLDTRVSIEFSNKKLNTVLSKLGKEANVKFSYNSRLPQLNEKISINTNNELLSNVLNRILKPLNIAYSEINNQIVLHKEELDKEVVSTPIYEEVAIIIKGKVTDEKGESLPGVSVFIKGTKQGATTDIDGKYSISVADNKAVLVFSFVGFASQEIVVGNKTQINVSLKSESKALDEIVLVGYGTQKKKDLTGAVGVVNIAKTMPNRPVTNIQELLAGSVPGLNVSKGSGAPGSGASLNIRGTSTIGGSSGVLVIVDGFPANIYTLNPNDVESISVLKDAASAAIYGSRAANGVILITTKKGKLSDKPIIEINSSISSQTPQFSIDFVGAKDYMKLWDQGLVNDGKPALYGAQGLADLAAGKYADNRWYKEIYKKSSFINNQSVSVSGGTDAISYRLFGSYDNQEGTLPNNNYSKYIFHPYISAKISKKLRVDGNIQYTQTYIHEPIRGTIGWQENAARIAPIEFIYTKNGQYGRGSSNFGNPVAGLHEGGFNESRYLELNTILGATFTPLKDWNITGNYSRVSSDVVEISRSLSYNLYEENGDVAQKVNPFPSQKQSYSGSYRNTFQVTSDYVYKLHENHNFKILGGYSQEKSVGRGYFDAYREFLPFSSINSLNTGSAINQQASGDAGSEVAIQSVFGRINYDYAGKYYLQANIRADGSSRFAKGHQWGKFPSFAAGWNIHKESFFKMPVISQLKLRGSWGILGDAEKVGPYATANVLAYDPQIYGFNGATVPGAYNNSSIDPNITWELAKQTNVGIDLGLFNQRLIISADYFYNKRQDILTNTVVPREFGLGGPVRNLYKLDNSGFEFLANYSDKSHDFRWGADFNFSFSKNKIVYIGDNLDGTPRDLIIDGNSYNKVGYQLGLTYGLVSDGLFQNAAEVTAQNQGVNLFPGNIKYKDVNGDGKSDGNDLAVINSKIPVRFGSNLNFGWKNFDLSASLYGSINNYRYLSGFEGWAFYISQNARPMALDNWTPDNPGASYPRISIQNTSNDTRFSDFWLRKASYLKIQNVQLGYNLPESLLKRVNIMSLRTYVSVQNLATITSYAGFDPEGGYYPISRTLALGVNVKF